MGKSIETPPPKFNVVFIGIFVVFKWDFLLSTKYCFLTLIFWDCHSKSFFSYLRYSGIVDSKKFHLKTKWKFLLSTFPEYQSKNKISNNIVFIGIFVVFKWDFLLSTKYCFLTLTFWYCHSKSFFSYLRYSGIIDSKKFHLKTTKWKFLLSTFPEYQSKKKISNNIESEGGGRGFYYLKKDWQC